MEAARRRRGPFALLKGFPPRFTALLAAVLAAALIVAACGSDNPAPAPTQPPAQPTPTTVPATATPEPPATDPPAVTEPPQDLAIDFTLPSARGVDVTLSSYHGEQAVILVFSRGLW